MRLPLQLTGWKRRTEAESSAVRGASRAFAHAGAHVFLYSWSALCSCFPITLIGWPNAPRSATTPWGKLSASRATQQAAIRMIRRLDNRRWAGPIQDAPHATRRVFVAEVGRKSGSRRASSEEYSSSCRKRSAMIRLPLFRVRQIFEYHSRGGPHSLFRDRTASDTDALQLEDVPTTESVHGVWRSQQLLSD